MKMKLSRFNVALLSKLAALFTFAKDDSRSMATEISGKHRQRFNLGGLPPAWKAKRMARIHRGGK